MEKQKNIIVFVNALPKSAVASVRAYAVKNSLPLQILLLKDKKTKLTSEGADIVIDLDFSKPWYIAKALMPYEDQLLAITCRAESSITRYCKVIPHVPYLRTPTTESLTWAIDKYEMRKRFQLFDPKHTPKFTHVKNNTKTERKRVVGKVGFPMVVKPASLASSALVAICYHEEELETTLRSAFRKIKSIYEKNNRTEEPKLMAEEYMEGEMYSIDAYVSGRGAVTHCPMVKVITGKNIGHDDFYNYLRITPVPLKKETIAEAQERVEVGIRALGLRYSTVHAELLLVDGDWKIIEIGPRIGGFRHVLHTLSCDIDHGMNDVLISMPKKPIVPKKCKGYAAAMRMYADHEGAIEEMVGIKKIRDLESCQDLKIKLKVGDRMLYSKNGGKGVFDLIMYNADRSKLLADIRRVEQTVKIKVANGNGSAKSKKPTKKTAKKVSKKVTKKSVTKTTRKK